MIRIDADENQPEWIREVDDEEGAAEALEKAEAGDLDMGSPALRVWVDDADEAPGGRVAHRVPGGLHYFDVAPEDGGVEMVTVPDSALWTDVVDRDDPRTWHPAARAADSGAAWRVERSRADDSPDGAVLKSDGVSLFTEHDGFPLSEMHEKAGSPPAEKAWTRYRGPMGGEGWVNTVTGEVSYTDQSPDADLEDYDSSGHPDMEAGAMANAREMDPDEAARLVSEHVAADAASLADAARSSPGIGGEAVARAAVQELQSENDEEAVVSLVEELYDAEPDEDDPDGSTDAPPPDGSGAEPFSARFVPGAEAAKSWVPYEGPQGGEGWRNVDSGEIVYDDEPPGETASEEDIIDAASEAGLDTEQVREAISEAREEDQGADRPEPSADHFFYGDEVTLEYNGEMVSGTVNDVNHAADRVYVDLEDGRTVATDVTAVESGGYILGDDAPQTAVNAANSVAGADTDDLDGGTEQKLRDRVVHDASNAVNPEVSDSMFSHVGTFSQDGTGDDNDRAYHTSKANYTNLRDAKSTMGLGESGSDEGTISHEFGHAMADSFGFGTPGENATAHEWSTGSRGPTEEGWDDGWDFGGQHDEKKDYLLTDFGRWEDRGQHDWSDYAERGETVTSEDDVSIGDRVAVRKEDVTGRETVVEGNVVPHDLVLTGPNQLPQGSRLTVSAGEVVSGRGWGQVDMDPSEGEVAAGVEAGDYLVIEEDNTYPLPEGALLDEYESDPKVIDVIEVAAEGYLVEDDDGRYLLSQPGEVTDAETPWEEPSYSVKDPNTGEETPLGGDNARAMELGEGVSKMEDATGRDWAPVEEYGEGNLQGKACRFKFGSQGTDRHGVITDETNGQFLVEYVDGNGNDNSRWVNKSQSFQQSVWVAEDDSEFGGPSASASPPGWKQAVYENDEYTEENVDWDTHVQYEDPEEVAGKVYPGDLLLVGVGGERVPMKVTDTLAGTGDDVASFEVRYGEEAAEQLRDAGDLPYGLMPYEDSVGGQVHYPSEDSKIWGHAEQEQFVGEPGEGVELESFDGDPADLEEGDVVEFRYSQGSTGTGRTKRATVNGITAPDGVSRRRINLDTVEDTFSPFTSAVEIEAAGGGAEDDPAEADGREAAEELFGEVNRAWYRMASDREDGSRTVGSIGSTYSEANAHETLAMTHEVMQGGRGSHTGATLHDHHPDLLMAYLDVFEPDDSVKETLNNMAGGVRSPFDEETPFPEVVPDETDYEEIYDKVSGAAVPAGHEGAGQDATIHGIVEGDLLYETPDGEEHRGDPTAFLETVKPPKGAVVDVPDGVHTDKGKAVVEGTSGTDVTLSVGGSTHWVELADLLEAQEQ